MSYSFIYFVLFTFLSGCFVLCVFLVLDCCCVMLLLISMEGACGDIPHVGGPTLCIGPCSARHWDKSTQQRESGLSQCTTHVLSQPGLLCLFPASAVPGRRQNTIVVKVPGQDDSHNEDGESGSEASDSVSNCGQPGSQNIGSNVTLITLNSEGAFPGLPWAAFVLFLWKGRRETQGSILLQTHCH